jgi:hypothetical protein
MMAGLHAICRPKCAKSPAARRRGDAVKSRLKPQLPIPPRERVRKPASIPANTIGFEIFRNLVKSPSVCLNLVCSSTYTRLGSTLTISGERDAPRWLLIRQINLFQILNYKMTMTIGKWLKEEKTRLARFKICCVNAQKAKSFPLKMPRSCWSGQYRTWDDSLDTLSIANAIRNMQIWERNQ